MDPFANLKNPRQLVRRHPCQIWIHSNMVNPLTLRPPLDIQAQTEAHDLKSNFTFYQWQPPTVLWNLFAYQTSHERKARHWIQKTLQPWNCRSSVSRELLPSCFSVEGGYESSPIKASVLEKGFLCLFHRIFQCVQNRVRSGRGDWERWSVHFSTTNLKFKDATWTLNKR